MTLITLDSDSWICDSLAAKPMRRASTRRRWGPFSFAVSFLFLNSFDANTLTIERYTIEPWQPPLFVTLTYFSSLWNVS